MKNVLLSVVHSKGSFTGKDKDGQAKEVEYDNVSLTYGRLDDYGKGITLTIREKIKTADFESYVGFSIDDFISMFFANFFGHEINVFYTPIYSSNGDLIRNEVSTFDILPESCYISFTPQAVTEFEDNLKMLVSKK